MGFGPVGISYDTRPVEAERVEVPIIKEVPFLNPVSDEIDELKCSLDDRFTELSGMVKTELVNIATAINILSTNIDALAHILRQQKPSRWERFKAWFKEFCG